VVTHCLQFGAVCIRPAENPGKGRNFAGSPHLSILDVFNLDDERRA
jgi:hypothetical protein